LRQVALAFALPGCVLGPGELIYELAGIFRLQPPDNQRDGKGKQRQRKHIRRYDLFDSFPGPQRMLLPETHQRNGR